MEEGNLPGTKPPNPFTDLLRELPNVIQHIQVISKLQREKYLALISEGFNDQQAIELSKNLFARME